MTVDVMESGVVTAVPGEQELRDAMPNPNRIFVDSSGRRARWVGRLGYLLGVGCATYVGMVALGLSGTRVAPMTMIPITEDNRIIAGLSGQTGSIGLRLTETPYVAPPVATVAPVRRAAPPVRRPVTPAPVKVAATTPAGPASTGPTSTGPTSTVPVPPSTNPAGHGKETKPGKSAGSTKDAKPEKSKNDSKPSKSDTKKAG